MEYAKLQLLPSAYEVRGKVNVLTHVCQSFCLSTPGEGGTRVRSRWGVIPKPGPGPAVRPGQEGPLPGGTPPQVPPVRPGQGEPHLGYPPSDLAGGVPQGGETPIPPRPVRPRVIDGVLDMLRSVCLLRSRRRTFLYFDVF